VHILHPPPDDALSHLKDHVDPSIRITTGSEPLQPDVDVLVHGRPSAEQLAACPKLKALIIPYAGVPAETRKLLIEAHPTLAAYNLHHNAAAASELALALLFAAAKTLIPVDRRFREHDWRSRYDGAPTMLLDGKTAVILGFGAIGSRIATVCHALGMSVHAVRRHLGPASATQIQLHSIEELTDLLPQADVLCIALPLTAETEGLIGAAEIAKLPSSCVLVNIARGAIVDEGALYRALNEERIAAAGIDVWYNYPDTAESRANTPPSRFPFYELDNVVMSPHRGGAFRLEELERHRMTDLAHTLNAIARGKDVPHRVDIQAGY
jgi:phosphoglycerate dehydrogenase-like enzyme